MGGGPTYSKALRTTRLESAFGSMEDFCDKVDKKEIFKNRAINNAMNPYGVKVRESRDSAEHPNSLAMIVALDLTGSMGSVPHFLVKEGLPNLMEKIVQRGQILDLQVMFVGVGDHECDQSPLQIGQFETSDELMDKWLMDVYLEGGGGGNPGESYFLAWYFAACHTSIDCWEKRKQKGILFTIGDEPCLRSLPKSAIEKIMGPGQYENFDYQKLYERACETYHVFHINVSETGSGSRPDRMAFWTQLMGPNALQAQYHGDIADIIADTVIRIYGNGKAASTVAPSADKPEKEEMML